MLSFCRPFVRPQLHLHPTTAAAPQPPPLLHHNLRRLYTRHMRENLVLSSDKHHLWQTAVRQQVRALMLMLLRGRLRWERPEEDPEGRFQHVLPLDVGRLVLRLVGEAWVLPSRRRPGRNMCSIC